MTTVTVTLAEWLLTQIAIDEDGRARTLRDMAEVLRNVHGLDLAADYLDAESKRVKAECEAKRQIVKRYARLVSRHEEFPELTQDQGEAREVLRQSLCDLALPYADRPGYRQEWRP